MPHYVRIGKPIFDVNGVTKESIVRFSNASALEIEKGNGGGGDHSFRLKFCGTGGMGWWVNHHALGQLIAELLYIKKEYEEVWGNQIDVEEGREARPEEPQEVFEIDPREGAPEF